MERLGNGTPRGLSENLLSLSKVLEAGNGIAFLRGLGLRGYVTLS